LIVPDHIGRAGGRPDLFVAILDFFLRRAIEAEQLGTRLGVFGAAGARRFGFHFDAQCARWVVPMFFLASVLLGSCYGHINHNAALSACTSAGFSTAGRNSVCFIDGLLVNRTGEIFTGLPRSAER